MHFKHMVLSVFLCYSKNQARDLNLNFSPLGRVLAAASALRNALSSSLPRPDAVTPDGLQEVQEHSEISALSFKSLIYLFFSVLLPSLLQACTISAARVYQKPDFSIHSDLISGLMLHFCISLSNVCFRFD